MLLWLFYVHPVEVSIEQSNAFKIKRKVPNWKPLFIFRLQETHLCCISGVFLFLMERNKRETTTTECGHQGATPTSGEEDIRSRGHFIQEKYAA